LHSSQSIEKSLWIHGFINGHDYVLTRNQFVDIRLVSDGLKVAIIVAAVLPLLFAGGVLTDVSFLVPGVVYPIIIEIISRTRRKGLLSKLERSDDSLDRLNSFTRKLNWPDVETIRFQGWSFTITSSAGGKRKKLRGFTRYSNVAKIIGYLRSVENVPHISVREVDWIYALISYYPANLLVIVSFSVPFSIILILAILAIGFSLVFVLRLVRSKTIRIA
jgi:hypothetical protein